MKEKKLLTPAGLKKIKKELKERKEVRREELKDTIEELRDDGDLSENEGYHLALQEKDMNEARINELEDIVENAEVVEKCDTEGVCVGSRVKVEINGETKEFTVVGTEETDPMAGQISHKSPIGKALLDKEVGEKVKIKTPNGEVEYKILEINDTV